MQTNNAAVVGLAVMYAEARAVFLAPEMLADTGV